MNPMSRLYTIPLGPAIISLCFFTLLLPQISEGEMYKWTDKYGAVHFSDLPPQEPLAPQKVQTIPQDNRNTKMNIIPAPRIEERKEKDNDSASMKGPIETKANPKVELYITSWCTYCKKAINFFQSRGIPFTTYNIEKDAAAARRKKQLTNRTGVPFAVINGQGIYGYSELRYKAALSLTYK